MEYRFTMVCQRCGVAFPSNCCRVYCDKCTKKGRGAGTKPMSQEHVRICNLLLSGMSAVDIAEKESTTRQNVHLIAQKGKIVTIRARESDVDAIREQFGYVTTEEN